MKGTTVKRVECPRKRDHLRDTILDVARSQKKDVVFVSGDQKPDWCVKVNNTTLYPRYELINEFCLASDGKSFHIVKFSDFLELFGAKAEVIEEIRKEEDIALVNQLSTPPVSPRIVRAWFDGVINPLLGRLTTEQDLLQRKNWTWEMPPGTFREITAIKGSLGVLQDLFDQFLKFYPLLKEEVDWHDQQFFALFFNCRDLQQLINKNDRFRELYRQAKADNTESFQGQPLNSVFNSYSEDEHCDILAQYIVNKSGELPPHNTYRVVWNKYREQLLSILDIPEICEKNQLVEQAGERLLKSACRFSNLLKEIRDHLSLKFGEPLY